MVRDLTTRSPDRHYVRFEVLMALNTKMTVFQDVTPCSLIDRCQRFEKICTSTFKMEATDSSENWSRLHVVLLIVIIIIFWFLFGSRDSSVGIATGWTARVRFPARFIFSPQRPLRLWGPPSLLSNGYRGLFLRGQSSRGLNLTTHLHLVPRSRMVELYLRSPIRLHGVVLN
jgi:hypothetical protein